MRLVKEIEYSYKIKNQKDIDKIKDIFRMLSIGFKCWWCRISQKWFYWWFWWSIFWGIWRRIRWFCFRCRWWAALKGIRAFRRQKLLFRPPFPSNSLDEFAQPVVSHHRFRHKMSKAVVFLADLAVFPKADAELSAFLFALDKALLALVDKFHRNAYFNLVLQFRRRHADILKGRRAFFKSAGIAITFCFIVWALLPNLLYKVIIV